MWTLSLLNYKKCTYCPDPSIALMDDTINVAQVVRLTAPSGHYLQFPQHHLQKNVKNLLEPTQM